MESDNKIQIGLIQIGNSFSGQYYLPYSIGLLHSYALKYLKKPDNFNFLMPIFSRLKVADAVKQLNKADIVFFSAYLWNFNLNIKIASELKSANPDIVIVFGGHQIPKRVSVLKDFLSKYPFIDVACFGEGERPVLEILENFRMRSWENVPSIGYRDKQLCLTTPIAERILDLDQIPSPYLTGVFDPLLKKYPQIKWSVMWETNRGCPFSCAYCAWGSNTDKKVYRYGIHRLREEIDWFSENKIEFVFCCDANFGMFDRDSEIVEAIAQNKKKTGYPMAFSVQNTKNSSKKIYNLQKLLTDYSLQKGVNLALQSINKQTLDSINRANISSEAYQELQCMFAADGIPTFTDIILGLPDESCSSFMSGVSRIIENGQYNNIQFINLTILENTVMADPDYQKRFGLILQESKIIYHHGSIEEEEVDETQYLVVGTRAMPKDEWVKARIFSWLVSLLFFDKLLQIPLIFMNKIFKTDYKVLIELFMTYSERYPLFFEMYSFLRDKAMHIQTGGTEYIPSKEWLNIWWPVDEYLFIALSVNDRLDQFYNEAGDMLVAHCQRENIPFSEALIKDCISLNQNLIKQPNIHENINIELSFNIVECYVAFLRGKDEVLREGQYNHNINRTTEKWVSWDEWLREAVWYGKKRGNFLYDVV